MNLGDLQEAEEHLPAESDSPAVKTGRRPRLLTWTLGINIACLLLHSMLICGCHFHPSALIVAGVPFFWGFYLFAFRRAPGERLAGYIAVGLAAAWVYFDFTNNSVFALKSIVYHLTLIGG